MKNFYLTSILSLVLSISISAQSLYWVGGSGNWEDPVHWATTSDGNGGYGIPDENTTAYFTQKSLSAHDVITISENINLSSLSIKNTPGFTIEFQGDYIHILNDFIAAPNGKLTLNLNNSTVLTSLQPQFNRKVIVTNGSFVIGSEHKKWIDGNWQIEYDTQRAGHTVVLAIAQPVCNGGTGTCLASASGGNGGPFLYFYTGGIYGGNLVQVNPAIGLTAGAYTSVVLDVSDNSLVFTNFLIIDPFPLNVVFIDTPPSCPGASDGSIQAFFNGGTAPTGYTAAWSTGFTENNVFSSTLANIPAGPYSVTVSDGNGCTIVRNDTLIDPDPIISNPVITDVSCFGFSNGSVFLNPTSGNPGPFTYLWSPGGEITSFLINQIAGSYDVHIEDINGCPKDTTIIISEPSVLTASITSLTHLLCNGDCSVGEATITPIGGTIPYTYQWFDAGNNPIPGLTDSTATNLCAGTYSVTATDANLCTVTIMGITITEPTLLTAVSSATPATCNGDSDGTVVVTPSGGTEPYAYLWENAGNPVGTDSLITGLPLGTYDYTVTDANGCVITGSVNVIEPAVVDYILTTVDLLCFGDVNGQASVSNVTGGDGNYSYLWLDNGGNTIGTGISINTLSAGLYTITVTDGNGCFKTEGFEIIEPLPITLTLTADDVTCFGFSDGAVHVVATGGTIAGDYVYAWTDAFSNPVGNTADVFGLPAGTYTVTVSDDNLCTQTGSIDIDEPAPIVVVETITDITCNGDGNGSISIVVNGGTPAYLFSWTGPGGFTSNSQNISNLEGGDYNLTLTDANLCVFNQTYTVDEPAPITFTPTITDILCFGDATGEITVVVNGGNGGYIYDWRDATNTQISTTDQIINVIAGDYTLTVTDALGCTHFETYTINEASEFFFNTTVTPITCFGATDGAIDLNPIGGTPGYTFSWTADNGFTSNNQNISNLASGMYNVEMTDLNGCVRDTTIDLIEPPAINVTENIVDVTCNGDGDGSITITVNGGVLPYLFDWTGPGGFTSTNQDISNLDGGIYVLTLTDANNCVFNQNYTVNEPAPITFTPTITDVLCFGDATGEITVVVNGGNGGYIYDWRDAANTQISTTDQITNVVAGDYTLIVIDALGCTHFETYTINEASEFFFNAIVTPITCFGVTDGAIDLNPAGGTPGYVFSWTADNGFTSNNQNISNLASGMYTVEMTDLNGCLRDTTIDLIEPAQIIVTESIVDVTCNGDGNGSITITVNGGVLPYLFDWTGPAGFTSSDQDIANLNGGVYALTIIDANNCVFNQNYTVNEPAAITFTPTITDVLCFGDATGEITVVVNGGNGGYIYDWRDTANTQISITDQIANVVAGDYTLTVVDALGCSYFESYTINTASEFFFNALITPITCFNDIDGAIDLNPSGGTPGYTYSWTADNGFTSTDQNISNLASGIYTIEVTDFANCVKDTTIILDNPPEIVVIANVADVICNGDADGSIELTVNGGSPPFLFNWTGPNGFVSTDQDIFNLESGIYNLTVTDDHGCIDFESYTINEMPPIDITATITDILCKGDSTGSITVIVSGGNGGYIYDWRDVANVQVGTTDELNNVPAGDYTLTVTDALGCSASQTYTIIEPATAIDLEVNSIDVDCAGDATGAVSVLISGGTVGGPGDYIIVWTNSAGNVVGNTQVINNLPADSYIVSVTDLNNCNALDTAIINSPDPIIVTFDVTEPTCAGDMNGTVIATATGGTGNYFYIWENTANPGLIISITDEINNIGAGTYQVQVTDANFCSVTEFVTVDEPDSLNLSFAFTEPICNGDANGQIEVMATGGTVALDYQYEWMDAGMNVIGTNALVTGLVAGDYTITVTDDNGCQILEVVTLTEADALAYTPDIVQITCAGDDNGSIAVLVSGGTSPYSYEWTNQLGMTIGTDTIIENLAPGDYTFTTTDANGCVYSETYPIAPQSIVSATYTQFQLGDCSVSPPCIGAAVVVPAGGSGVYVNYQWVDVAGNDMGINNDTATALCSGSYLVTITDSDGCSGAVTVLIDDVTPESISVDVEDPTCSGEPGTAIAVYECIDVPCTIEWFNATTNTSTGLFTDTVQLLAGDYFIEITNGTGCKNHFPFTITDILPIVPNLSATGISCNGTCDGTAIASPTGGSGTYTYLWNDPMAQTTATAIDLCAGTYEVIITDALDTTCFVVDSVIVNNIDLITSTDTITNVSCNGGSDGIIELFPSGGSGLFTYTWNPAPPIGDGTSTGSGLAIGDYSIQIGDASNPNCFIDVSYTITQPDSLQGTTEVVQSTCGNADGEATVNPIGGTPPYNYLWNDAAAQTTQTATGLIAAIYNVIVTDSLGCFEVFTDAVSDMDADTLDLVIEAGLCFGDSSTVIAVYDCLNPTCIITWYDEMGNILPLTGDTVTMANGNYWVGIENSLGCNWFMSFEIVPTNPIVPDLFVLNETCNGPCDGIASVNPSGGNGGYTFLWAPEPAGGQGTNEATGLCIGTWEVTITDVMGCDTTITFDIGPYTPIEPNLTFSNPDCNGDVNGTAEVAPTGGNGFYTYLWSPEPLSGQGTNQVAGLFAGDWNVTVTDTSGCDTTVVFTIIEPELLDADSLVTNATCNDDPGDGSIILTVTGGTPPYNYQWFDAANNDLGVNNDTINNLTEGIYHCVVLDSNLCSDTFVAIISENSSETISAESQDIVCFGANDGMAWVTYNCSDAPCTVAWYDGLGVDLGLSTDTITNLSPGTYIVGVTNNSGCVVYQPVEVNEPPELFLNTTLTDASCSGVCDGEVIADVSGGVAPYTFLWTPEPGSGQGTSVAGDLCAGDYSLLLTDSVGCSITFDFTITELEGITSNLQSGDANCYDICDGWATVDPVGTSGSYSYLWSPEPDFGQGTDSVSGLCAGDWSVLITDIINGCNITDTFNISQPDSIWVSDTLIVTPECPADSSGSITITVAGGTQPYNYQWFVGNQPISGATDSSIIDLIPGDYTVEIIDANGCIIGETYLLGSISDLNADAGNDSTYCEGNGPAELIGSGNGITHVWLDTLGNVLNMGDTLIIDPPPGEHAYIFQVSDGICTASDTAWVNVLPAPVVDAGPDQEIIIDETVVIGGNPTAPDNSFINWSPSLGLSDSTVANPIASPIVTTEYSVYVVSENGCASNDTMLIKVVPEFEPNDGFTPNGDGINDVWIIGDVGPFPNIEVVIFNRWGELLFSSTGYSEPWDGRYDGKPVTVGTYYYVIDLHDEKYPDPFTGPLTIMR